MYIGDPSEMAYIVLVKRYQSGRSGAHPFCECTRALAMIEVSRRRHVLNPKVLGHVDCTMVRHTSGAGRARDVLY